MLADYQPNTPTPKGSLFRTPFIVSASALTSGSVATAIWLWTGFPLLSHSVAIFLALSTHTALNKLLRD